MKRKFPILSILIFFLPNYSFASYVNSCLLTGTVSEDTSTMIMDIQPENGQGSYEVSHLDVKFKVSSAEEHGRADSGCKQFVGKTLQIRIEQAPLISYKKGSKIKVVSFQKDIGTKQIQQYSIVEK